ncbi:MAG: AbrB/MazE/SpoVT family DNA-binding domain-containing protein [Fimbriimonas sp.]|nr:AbrB/MazE/SpoVT family DNA-binding domain-containing protein [Fimbriimonas sp.]
MVEVKVTQVGNSLGVVLPKDVLAGLKVSKGDRLYLLPSPDGYQLTALDPEIAQQIERAEAISRRFRNALKKLAK